MVALTLAFTLQGAVRLKDVNEEIFVRNFALHVDIFSLESLHRYVHHCMGKQMAEWLERWCPN